MIHLCLFEDNYVQGLSPLVQMRAAYQLRTGAQTLLERVKRIVPDSVLHLHARGYLADFVASQTGLPVNDLPANTGVLFLNGRIATLSEYLVDTLEAIARSGGPTRIFTQDDVLVAAWVPEASSALVQNDALNQGAFEGAIEETVEDAVFISRLWHLIDNLHPTLLSDLEDMLRKAPSQSHQNEAYISPHATFLNASSIHLAPGSRVRAGAILDAHNGPVFLERDAEIMEQAIVRGPIYIGRGSTIKAHTEIEGSAIGPVCKIAGEVMDVIFHSYSNKAHTGFLGHSYLSTWCNLGAGTISSNLRNDYDKISLYSEMLEQYEPTNRQFLGMFLADHSKCGINTMVNTGTVAGVFCSGGERRTSGSVKYIGTSAIL
jgi:UDP-N-acetylglucosamine diphosphorylase/glucosamine-1-phosphate N-acetyltransferase